MVGVESEFSDQLWLWPSRTIKNLKQRRSNTVKISIAAIIEKLIMITIFSHSYVASLCSYSLIVTNLKINYFGQNGKNLSGHFENGVKVLTVI